MAGGLEERWFSVTGARHLVPGGIKPRGPPIVNLYLLTY